VRILKHLVMQESERDRMDALDAAFKPVRLVFRRHLFWGGVSLQQQSVFSGGWASRSGPCICGHFALAVTLQWQSPCNGSHLAMADTLQWQSP
jgi:hypothetical protein